MPKPEAEKPAAPKRSQSYARDHLANERTFLAWLRTAVSMMGFGILIVKLRYMVPHMPVTPGPFDAQRLGMLFALAGCAMMPFALCHYFATRRAIDDDNYTPAGAGIVVFGVVILFIGVGVMIYLLNSPPPAP